MSAAEPVTGNLLGRETSPYLLQHADNPVHWMPWGDAAFEKARTEDKPVFLSLGYSTCHWCHVMAHESFEDEAVAAILNAHFVCIKVDREELPDVDELYMRATSAFTGRGGWPNSVWLTADRKPWFAGTYFPKEDRGGRPGFKTILLKLADGWKNQRDQINTQAERFAEVLADASSPDRAAVPLSLSAVDRAIRTLRNGYDAKYGGFGGAPKFPPHGALALMAERQSAAQDLTALDVISHTLDAMAAGGLHDHVGGGFHRYSTDAKWLLPHFEKMLYDNAQLIRAYTAGHRLTGYDDYTRVVQRAFVWLEREMTDPAGGFYSALDADSDGEEGKFYVWTTAELKASLGEEDGDLIAKIYSATEEGNFHDEASGMRTGANILHLNRLVEDWAEELKTDADVLRKRVDQALETLRADREKRVRPHLDDKVLTSWNGLMIGALSRAGTHFKQPSYTAAAQKAAEFIESQMRTKAGRLMRTWRDGKAKLPGYLDDYAYCIDGFLELHAATQDKRWLATAQQLTDLMIEDFYDDEAGGFFYTSRHHDALLGRSKGLTGGGNLPTPNGVAAQALIRLSTLTKDKRYAEYAVGTLRATSGLISSNPHSTEALLVALEQFGRAKESNTLPADLVLAPVSNSKADAHVRLEPVTVEVFAEALTVKPGDTVRVAVRITTDPNWHVYAHQPGSPNLIPTKIEPVFDVSSAPIELGAITYPAGNAHTDPVLNQTIHTYEGATTLLVPVTIKADAPLGETPLSLRIHTQACDDKVCLGPERHELTIKLIVDPNATPEKRHPEAFAP